MSKNINEVIEQHQVSYEVRPYYEIAEERKPRTPPITRRIQAGFDIDVYGIKANYELTPGPGYALFHATLEKPAGSRRSLRKKGHFQSPAKSLRLSRGFHCPGSVRLVRL